MKNKQKYCHTTNKINIPPFLISHEKYNSAVTPESWIKIDGVTEYHPDLFKRVMECETPFEASATM